MRLNPLLLWLFVFSFCGAAAQQTVGLFVNEPTAFNGYTLFGNNKKTYLIDNCGFIINTWESEYNPGLTMYLLENGNLLRAGKVSGSFSGGGLGGQFELFNWENDLIWSYKYASSTVHAHHDIEPLPNGNFLAIAWEKHAQSDAQNNGRKYSGEVWSEQIIEFKLIGNNQAEIIWKWSLWDHLVQDYNSSKLNFGNIAMHPELIDINYIGEGEETDGDWVHLNAIDYNESLDQIAVSSRNFSEIWVIDHSTTISEAASHSGGNSGKGGDVLYRFGNPQAYGRGDAGDQVFFRQHDVRWIPAGFPNEGKMMIFNNDKLPNKSSVEMWMPPISTGGLYEIENGQPFGPANIDWEYTANGLYSSILSGAQMQPNGNVLICEGDDGYFIEVTHSGNVVWEYINPVNQNGFPVSQGGTPLFNDVFRIEKYPPGYPAFIGKEMTPGNPIEINPWSSDCEIFDMEVGVENNSKNPIVSLLKNPISGKITFNLIAEIPELEGRVFDLLGREMVKKELVFGFNEIDISEMEKGLYVLVVFNDEKPVFTNKIIFQ